MIARAVVIGLVTLVGVVAAGAAACKTDRAPPAPRPTEPPRPRGVGAPVADARTTERPATPLDLARVQELEPSFDGATVMAPARMHQADQARQIWCMPGRDAGVIATAIAGELGATGWTEVASRGTGERAGASATRDGIRISISIGGRDASCAGLVATAVFAGPTVTLPELAPGERIR